MSDALFVVIDGEEYSQWSEYDIDSDLMVDADSWSLRVDNFWEGDVGLFRKGALAEVYVNGWLQLVGVIEDTDYANSKDSGSVASIGGRSLAGLLVDSSPMPGRFANRTFIQVCEDLCAPFGIEVVVTDPARARATGRPGAARGTAQVDQVLSRTGIPLDDLRTQTGDTVWGFLAGIAERLELAIWMTPDGKLAVARPAYDAQPQFSLTRARYGSPQRASNNVIDGNLRESIAERYSTITGVGQATVNERKTYFAGTPNEYSFDIPRQVSFTYAGTDEEMARVLHKPLRQSYNVPTRVKLEEAVEADIRRRRFESYEVEYVVAGHSQNGTIWQPDTTVAVYDEVLNIDEVLYCTGRRFTRSRDGGTRTQLRLRKRGIWLA